MALTPKRLFLYLCISISLLRPYTLFSRSPLVNKTLFENTPASWNFDWGSTYTRWAAQETKFNDNVESDLCGEVSKTFIIVRFGLGSSNQLNSTTGLTLCHVATMACTERNHIPINNWIVVMAVIRLSNVWRCRLQFFSILPKYGLRQVQKIWKWL